MHEVIWKKRDNLSKLHWLLQEPETFSPPTRLYQQVLIVSHLALIEQYLGKYAREQLGLTLNDLLALGRKNPDDSSENFNMAYLAIRGSNSVNGVSRLHGKVSRHLFEPLFSNWPTDEVPVGYITNGVHMPSWDSAAADELWTEACGKDRWAGTSETLEQKILRISDNRIWQFRTNASKPLIEYARQRLARHYAAEGAHPEVIEEAKHLFDPNVLIIGFARRFAPYKRPNLLLHDPERLFRLLSDPKYPVQLVIAGKAHPADEAGSEHDKRMDTLYPPTQRFVPMPFF